MRKFFTTAAFLLAAVSSVAAEEYTTRIDLQNGERWWGVFLSGSLARPLAEPFSINTGADASTLNMPFLISTTGRYIWSTEPMEIDFDGQGFTVRSEHEKVNAKRAGRTLREAYLIGSLTHFPPQGTTPDADLFTKPIYLTEFELGHAQGHSEILGYAGRIISEGFPPGIIVIPDGWQSANGPYWFDQELYPDPKATIEALHELGFKVMLTVTPFIPASGRNYVNALRSGQIILDEAGSPALTEGLDGSANAMRNLADMEQYNILNDGIRHIRESLPVDGFRFDDRDMLSALPEDITDGFASNWYKLGEGIAYADYSGGTSDTFATHVAGITAPSEAVEQELISSAVTNVVAAGMAGYPYSHISSSMTELPAGDGSELLMAAFLQLNSMMPVVYVDFAPWRIGNTELHASVRDALNYRAGMAGYIETLVSESARTAEPIVRHMEYQFPKSGFADCNDQFMLGSKYLIAPCTGTGGKRIVRLPRGTWTDLEGNRWRGPVVIEADCSRFGNAVFVLN